ncbi:MAG TPA: papain-like cysteine protease family protein [Puia sp.]|nr:papain-like cysteine protease family protein [Puia sp.]
MKIQFSIVPIKDTVDEIIACINEFYKKDDTDQSIGDSISDLINTLKEYLWSVIEYPYVDKVYRDSYYSYFASKHNPYYRDCIRVSFFSEEVEPGDFRDEEYKKTLSMAFMGYLIIRPTFSCPIGRSLLNKAAFRDDNFVICNSAGNVLINGVKLNVHGFPYSSQDTESISCTETTIWSIMEYFGNRYPDYRPTYPSHILDVLSKFSKQRLLPSNGLTVDQISFALKEFGFGTNIYARDAYGAELENIIAYYIESGIPVIAAIQNETIGHAIVIIGHETDPAPDFGNVNKREINYKGETCRYIDYTDLPKKYIVNDDNLPPYRKVDLSYPVVHYGENSDFRGCVIESAIVPLYKKIYLEVTKARELALAILSDPNFGYRFDEGFVFRFFLTSSRSFKEHISQLPTLNRLQKDYIILSQMPKFVWCAEIYEQDDFQHNKATGLIILDATEANQVWVDSLIFAGYPDRIFVKDEGEFVILQERLNLYQRFKNNLN